MPTVSTGFRVLAFPIVTALIFVVGIAVSGFSYVRSEQIRLRHQVEEQLAAIADLKIAQIVAWRKERLGDAEVLTHDALLATRLASILERRQSGPLQAEFQPWFDAFARSYGYTNVTLIGTSGSTLATSGSAAPPSSAHAARHLLEAARHGKAVWTELEADERTGRIHVDLLAPLFDPAGRGALLGGVLLRIDPADFLYPLIQSWPTPSPTAESLLIRVEGDSIVFLNELRHSHATALSLRMKLSDRELPAARVALGEQGVVSGVDYRGVEVLAAGRAIPDSSWFLVAKVDRAEILAPAQQRAALLATIVLLLIVSAVGSAALWWRHQTALRERDRFEEAQRQLALTRHLELLSEHADDVVLMVDHSGRIVRANDRVLDHYGWSNREMVGTEIRALRSSAEAEKFDAQMGRIRREGRLRFETVHRRRDGTEFPVEVSARSFEAEGRWFFQAIIRDVSERKRVQKALSYQAELLRNLYDAVIGLDAEHVIRSWNPAAERIYGLTAEEVVGRPMSEVLTSEYKGYSYPDFVATLNRSDRLRFEVRRRLRGGQWVDIEAAAVVLRDEQHHIVGYVTVNRDVTVRRRAEAALRASQERLARILETSSEGIWIVDVQGTTEFVNARAARLFGTTPDALVGRRLLDVIPEQGRANARADLETVSRGECVKREFVMSRPDGSEVWINISWSALRDPDGRVVGAVALYMDVTEHRRAREQLLQAQKMDAVGRLASGIAHDFNNLLVVILSCSRFLLEGLPEDDARRSDIEDIKEAGDRAANLVRQLLAFGRRSPQLNTVVDLNEVVGGVEKLLRRTIGEHISMTVSLAPDPWPTTIDPTHFEQVLLNLALNARDAMPTGGELRVSTSNSMLEHPPANCEGLAPGRYALLTIEDTGSGMIPEILSKMFEPFFTTKEKGKGTGLGLSTVYGIVEEAHGKIAVTSVPGRGTTFTVYLPACDEAQVLSPPLQDVSRKRGQGEKILLVEDEDKVRGIARRILEDSGFRVIAASSAAAALRHLQDGGAADLVLSDIVMPQVSGTELATSIRALRPGLPVVLMSGYSEWQRMSPEYGPVLQKPFTAEGLVARLQEALTASAAA